MNIEEILIIIKKRNSENELIINNIKLYKKSGKKFILFEKTDNHFINFIIKILLFFKGYNKKIKLNTISSDLTKDEKWAIDYIEKNKKPKIINTDNSLIDIKGKEIAKYFINHIKDRYEDDSNDSFNESFIKCGNEYRNIIIKKHYKFMMNLLENPPVKTEEIKKSIPFYKKFFNKINNCWKIIKEKRVNLIISSMNERFEIIKFNNFKKNFRFLDNGTIQNLYRGVQLNKKIIERNNINYANKLI